MPLAFKLRKSLYRCFRYHSSTEWIQNVLRRSSTLALPEVGMKMEILPGEVIIDCGANVGDLTSRFARTGANIYAFEPNPLAYDILIRRFRWLKTVKCYNKGVMDRDCVLSLHIPAAHGQWDAIEATVSSSFVARQVSPTFEMRKLDVACVDLIKFVLSLERNVRLLKVDIEGAEIAVLDGLMNSGAIYKIDQLIVETHEKQRADLIPETEALRRRIRDSGLASRVNLDWP